MQIEVLAKRIRNDSTQEASLRGSELLIGTSPIDLASCHGYRAFFKRQDGTLVDLDGTWVVMLRDAPSVLRTTYFIQDMREDAVATVWSENDLCVAIVNAEIKPCDAVKPADAGPNQGGRHNLDLLGDHFPSARKLWHKWSAWQEHIATISPAESLAALEKQVDLLTEIVMDLLPEGDQKQHLAAFAECSSNTQAGIDEALEFKRALRAKVAEYRRTRGRNS